MPKIDLEIGKNTKILNIDADVNGTISELSDYIVSEISKQVGSKVVEALEIKLGKNIRLICKYDKASQVL